MCFIINRAVWFHIWKKGTNVLRNLFHNRNGITFFITIPILYIYHWKALELYFLMTWLFQKWVDEYMQWDPALYSGVTSVRMESRDVWRPDIMLYNTWVNTTSVICIMLPGWKWTVSQTASFTKAKIPKCNGCENPRTFIDEGVIWW